MEQNILSEGQLLDAKGNLNEAGFAYSLVKQYQRDNKVGIHKECSHY